MPPRKDFRQPRETDGVPGNGGGTIDDRTMDEQTDRASIRDHPMKKMQAKSHDGHGITLGLHEKPPPTGLLSATSKESLKLNRSNDLLAQSSTETLLDMLKAHASIKECSEETEKHINGVRMGWIGPRRSHQIYNNSRVDLSPLQILTELYSRVKGARGRWRCAVLGALYGLVECSSSKILLSVARVVLAVSTNTKIRKRQILNVR